jgi:hypothetical protein
VDSEWWIVDSGDCWVTLCSTQPTTTHILCQYISTGTKRRSYKLTVGVPLMGTLRSTVSTNIFILVQDVRLSTIKLPPFEDGGTPTQASTKARSGDRVTSLNFTRSNCFIESDRNRSRRSIAIFSHITNYFLCWNV